MTIDKKGSEIELIRIASTLDQSTLLDRPKNRQEMVNQAVAIVLEPSFIEAIDAEVGIPLEGESRKEFVLRAKKVIIEKLTNIIG